MARLLLVLAFLAAQFAPAMHAFHAEEEFAPHCTDGAESTHWCACTLDHDAPECTLCAHAAKGATCGPPALPELCATGGTRAAPVPFAVLVSSVSPSAAPRGPPSFAHN